MAGEGALIGTPYAANELTAGAFAEGANALMLLIKLETRPLPLVFNPVENTPCNHTHGCQARRGCSARNGYRHAKLLSWMMCVTNLLRTSSIVARRDRSSFMHLAAVQCELCLESIAIRGLNYPFETMGIAGCRRFNQSIRVVCLRYWKCQNLCHLLSRPEAG